jgi:hypothetical protein
MYLWPIIFAYECGKYVAKAEAFQHAAAQPSISGQDGNDSTTMVIPYKSMI